MATHQLINNTVSYEMTSPAEEGEGKALGQADAKSSSKSSDVSEACGVKNKIMGIFIPAE